jgi:N-acyl-D-amino-acid deacylase
MVNRQTRDTAQIYGMKDRGSLKPGYLADIKIIDFDNLSLPSPNLAFDLPAGGRRLVQTAHSYLATIKTGQIITEKGEKSGTLPGKLVRGPQSLPASCGPL